MLRVRLHASVLGAIAAATTVALAACLSSQDVDLGRDIDAGAPASSAARDTGADVPIGVTPVFSVVITGTSSSVCDGECVTLLANASGGATPYAYAWGQDLGEGPGPKTFCPTATETVSVVATPAGSEVTATASTTIIVQDCGDGETTPPPQPPPGDDGGTPPGNDTLCVPDPSFEGVPRIGAPAGAGVPASAAPPDWQVCLGTPDIDPILSLLPAADGMTYVGLEVGVLPPANMDATEAIGAPLCAPLVAGAQYAFCIDLGIGVRGLPNAPGAIPPSLQIWGSEASCVQEDLLWTSPPITNSDTWAKVCGSFLAPRADTNIELVPAAGTASLGAMNWSYVIVDDLTTGP